ncbi:MAG: GIY-YIG nuclease family protein [Verrucomicrobiales bacterium]
MTLPLRKDKPDLNAKLHEVPHRPGIYLMRDRINRVIYVGKARDLRKRLSSYFAPSRLAKSDLKTRSLILSIWDFEVHEVRNEPEALLLEGKLIKEYRPRYNISFRDDKRFLLVKVNLADPFPRFQLTRLKKDDGSRYFGPFAHSGSLRSTLNLMKKLFGLRSCRPHTPTEADYKHCLNDVIKNCSAPCVAKISREEYMQRVSRACEFLEGRSHEMQNAIEEEMRSAAQRKDFEKAAQLRDMLHDLQRTTKPMRRFTRTTLPRSKDPLRDVELLKDALRMSNAPLRMECFDISNISNTHVVASMVAFKNGVPDKSNYRRYRVKNVVGQNDFASMAEVVRRRYSRVLKETGQNIVDVDSQLPVEEQVLRVAEDNPDSIRLPDLIIVDGGRGQLSAACAELQRLGLHEVPIIGLAKEREEIYRPQRPLPLQLPMDSPALMLLQRIRDEAHRFANGYHQLLLKRRVDESILDDCPGISQSRKQALLKAFGSVQRLRKTPVDQIDAVPNIGPRLAANLSRFLQRHKERDQDQDQDQETSVL